MIAPEDLPLEAKKRLNLEEPNLRLAKLGRIWTYARAGSWICGGLLIVSVEIVTAISELNKGLQGPAIAIATALFVGLFTAGMANNIYQRAKTLSRNYLQGERSKTSAGIGEAQGRSALAFFTFILGLLSLAGFGDFFGRRSTIGGAMGATFSTVLFALYIFFFGRNAMLSTRISALTGSTKLVFGIVAVAGIFMAAAGIFFGIASVFSTLPF